MLGRQRFPECCVVSWLRFTLIHNMISFFFISICAPDRALCPDMGAIGAALAEFDVLCRKTVKTRAKELEILPIRSLRQVSIVTSKLSWLLLMTSEKKNA